MNEERPSGGPPPLPPEPRVQQQMPVDVRSASLIVLAVLACVFVLHWASAVFIPLMVGVVFSYALSPAVDRMERWRVPRALGAALVMGSILGAAGWMAYSLADDAAALIETLPDAAQKVRESLQAAPGNPDGPIEKVQKAAAQLEQAAEERGSKLVTDPRGVTRVVVEKPRFNVKDYLWSGTLGLVGFAGQTLVVSFITFFLLVAGSTFRRKLVRIAGPTFSRKKITIQALDEITGQIQRYMLVQVFTSLVVGVATWLAFLWIGLKHAAVWGVAAGVLDLIPYIGLVVIGGSSAVVGFLQFGTLDMAVLISGVSVVIHGIEAYLLTPWLTSQTSRMNPVVIFVGVLAWGWLWGLWGLLLGVPILMIVKAVCDRVDDLKPVGELLGS